MNRAGWGFACSGSVFTGRCLAASGCQSQRWVDPMAALEQEHHRACQDDEQKCAVLLLVLPLLLVFIFLLKIHNLAQRKNDKVCFSGNPALLQCLLLTRCAVYFPPPRLPVGTPALLQPLLLMRCAFTPSPPSVGSAWDLGKIKTT